MTDKSLYIDPFVQIDSLTVGNLCVEGDAKLKSGTYDVIVVGGGTAGAIFAKRLTDLLDCSVLVLEQGENLNDEAFTRDGFAPNAKYGAGNANVADRNPRSTDPVVIADSFTEYDFKTSGWGQMRGGRGWGGASNHNYFGALKHSPGWMNSLTAFGGANWSAAVLQPIYKAIETYTSFGPAPSANRGTTGPMSVVSFPHTAGFPDDLLAEMKAQSDDDAAVPIKFDYNDNDDRAFGQVLQLFIRPDTTRSHTGREYLGPDCVTAEGFGVNGRNLRVISAAHVTKVLFTDGTQPCASAVEVVVKGCKRVYYANKKIVLCAGAMKTPAILERSGVGSPAVLAAAGVDVLYANENVGENLQTHTGCAVLCSVDPADHVNQQMNAFCKVVADGNGGVPPNGYPRLTQSLVLPGSGSIPGMQALIDCLGAPPITNPVTKTPLYISLNWNMQPTSRGSIHIAECNPFTQPELLMGPMSDEDQNHSFEMFRWWKRITDNIAPTNGPMVMHLPPTSADFTRTMGGEDSLRPYLRSSYVVTDHPCGTCKMGDESTQDGVVDGDLNVYGVKNLMIVDNSVWPLIPDGNTAFAAMVVGHYGADICANAIVPP